MIEMLIAVRLSVASITGRMRRVAFEISVSKLLIALVIFASKENFCVCGCREKSIFYRLSPISMASSVLSAKHTDMDGSKTERIKFKFDEDIEDMVTLKLKKPIKFSLTRTLLLFFSIFCSFLIIYMTVIIQTVGAKMRRMYEGRSKL